MDVPVSDTEGKLSFLGLVIAMLVVRYKTLFGDSNKNKFSKCVSMYTVSKKIELESLGFSGFKDYKNVFQI